MSDVKTYATPGRHIRNFAGRAGQAASQGAGYAQAGYGYGQDVLERRNGRSIGWMIVGYSLLAILVYIAIADKSVVSAIGGASTLGSRVIGAWVKPVDPIAALTGSLALNGGVASSGATSAGAAAAARGDGSAAPVLPPPPSPGSIARLPVSRLPRRTSSANKLWAQLRQHGVQEGFLRHA